MNYYEHHIGDYAQATAHLSFVEDAAFSRLLRKYYAEERPIPADLKAAQRLVGARTRDEREAVQTVLEEFFVLQDDGWHNKRADEEIARYREKQGKARASAQARWEKRNATAMRTHSESDANALPSSDANAFRTQCEGNAHQSPDTRHQTKALLHEGLTTDPPSAAVSVDPETERWGQFEGQAQAAAPPNPAAPHAIALRKLGFAVTASNPELVAYVQAGGDVQRLTELAELPEMQGKPPAYLIRTARRQLAEGAKPIPTGGSHAPALRGPRLGVADRVAANIASAVRSRADDAIDVDFVDVPG